MARKKEQVTVVGLSQGVALLREAILKGCWERAAQAFLLLTGEVVKPPQAFDREGFLNGVVSLIVDFTRGFSGGNAPPVAPILVEPTAQVRQPFAAPTPIIPSPAPASAPQIAPQIAPLNEFVDDGSVAAELIEDSRASSRHKERRRPFQTLELTCGRCGQKQSVHPSLRPVRFEKDDDPAAFTCDRCVGRRQ